VLSAGIDTRGRPGFPLKIKGVYRDIFMRFEGADSENRGFGPGL
jgi:hypothetical protein